MAPSWTGAEWRAREQTLSIPLAAGTVRAHVGMPPRRIYENALQPVDHVRGFAIFAHADEPDLNGFASRYLAGRLRLDGYATLRLDLTTAFERRNGNDSRSRYDLPSLVKRLGDVCDWVTGEGLAGTQRLILVGSGAAAAAGLAAASRRPGVVRGVLARGGWMDLASDVLSQIRAAVLVVAGADDYSRVHQSNALLSRLGGSAELVKVPRAARALGEPDAVGFLAERMVEWLDRLDRWDRKRLSQRLR